MKYEKIYKVNRKMHMRPLAEVIETLGNLHEKYPHIHISLQDPITEEFYEGRSISCLLTINPFKKDSQVKIIAEGKSLKKILKNCVEEIGVIFNLKTDERTMREILHKIEYGYFPDEKS